MPSTSTGSGGGSGSGTTNPPATNPLAQPSIYVVSDSHSNDEILAVPVSASGSSIALAAINGSDVSIDDGGNIYLLANGGGAINVYSQSSPYGTAVRTLPVGTGTHIPLVIDVQASATGEIVVSDGQGIAVFDPAASGGAAPVRYIQGTTHTVDGQLGPSGLIAVDRSDNVYVANNDTGTVSVYDAKASGAAAPLRVLSGLAVHPAPHIPVPLIYSLATDVPGNLYVHCYCINPVTNKNDFVTVEFAATANGSDAPTRTLTDPTLYDNSGGAGMTVDTAGTVYVSSSLANGQQTIFEFAASTSSLNAATNLVTIPDWTDSPSSRIAVH